MEFIHLVISLQQPILDLVNKHCEDHGVCPDVLVPQADQTPPVGGDFVELAEYYCLDKLTIFLTFYLIRRAEKK